MKRHTHLLTCVLALLAILLVCAADAAEQPPATKAISKEELEVQKLQLEVAALREAEREWTRWLTAALGLAAGIAGTATSVWLARRSRFAALNQAVHEKRLEMYVDLVKTSERLALHFPPAQAVTPPDCKAMGEALRLWYFQGGGLLMSSGARDAYFCLARALTHASLAADLNVPTFPGDALNISVAAIDRYRRELTLGDVEQWQFGGPTSASDPPAKRFKDFVFLQNLSSSLRTQLCADLHSRRRPS